MQATQLGCSMSNTLITYRPESVPLAVGTCGFLDTNSLAGATALTLLPDLEKIKDKHTQSSHFNQTTSRQQKQKSPGILRLTYATRY